ncbi:hypothetical protein [Geodermatophilus sp. DSM 45219]|uniref:hypothetical protein n=1 Tax=Geodermatophilus sp. DSM 45219 TaxID=1881103 RepID=UPI00088A3CC6|nr:hypothetical protein [Geodermatophilus sp. DSM 45219]SDO72568.1 hypothetical protein SAMN05428965_0104 [Geodermatophilus sp. DSM 45219]
MAVSNRVRSALTTTVLATAATGFLAACGTEEDEQDQEQVAYCTNEEGEIVDEEFCDDDYRGPGAGLFFLYLGGFRPGLPVGTVLPSGGTRINPTDTQARQRAGLPSTGRVAPGTRVTGGIGSGVGGGSNTRTGVGAGS